MYRLNACNKIKRGVSATKLKLKRFVQIISSYSSHLGIHMITNFKHLFDFVLRIKFKIPKPIL